MEEYIHLWAPQRPTGNTRIVNETYPRVDGGETACGKSYDPPRTCIQVTSSRCEVTCPECRGEKEGWSEEAIEDFREEFNLFGDAPA